MTLMNKWRVKEFGKGEKKNFKKDYDLNTLFFFVKDTKNKEVLAFGGLRPVSVEYQGKKYNILGVCNIISIKKKKSYGRILIQSMIKYSKRTGKTLLGFCERKNIKFYEKSGLKTKKDFTNRFAFKNPITKQVKFDKEGGDDFYYESKDKFISKVISTNGVGYYYTKGLKEPHW